MNINSIFLLIDFPALNAKKFLLPFTHVNILQKNRTFTTIFTPNLSSSYKRTSATKQNNYFLKNLFIIIYFYTCVQNQLRITESTILTRLSIIPNCNQKIKIKLLRLFNNLVEFCCQNLMLAKEKQFLITEIKQQYSIQIIIRRCL